MTANDINLRPKSLEAFGRALRKHRERRGLTLDALAQATGISKPYLSNIETGSAPGPASEEKLRRLAKALHLPAQHVTQAADWLRTPASIRRTIQHAHTPRHSDGTINLDALLPSSPPSPPSASATGESSAPAPRPVSALLPVKRIPLINRVAAGHAAEFTDLDYPVGIADQYVPLPDLPETSVAGTFGVRVIGDSMLPEYTAGELLIVGPGEPQDGDDCVVRLGEMENFATTFKRVYFEEEVVRLVAINRAYGERRVPLADVSGIYSVIWRLVPPRNKSDDDPKRDH